MVKKIFPKSITPPGPEDVKYQPDSSGTAPVRIELRSPRTDVQKRLRIGRQISASALSVIEEAFDTNLLRTLAKKSVVPANRSDPGERWLRRH